MLRRLLQFFRLKGLARQLRKPGGKMGHRVGQMMNRANEPLYRFAFDIMKPAYFESILEIGFGNGKFFNQLYQQAEGLDLTGIDYSATMVESAAKINAGLVQNGKLRLVDGNSDHMPFPDNSFDKIFCINVIYFWDEPMDHLREIYRVLKPGGRFFAIARTVESMMRMPFTKYGFRKYDEEKWRELTAAAGFTFEPGVKFVEPVSEFQPDTRPFESICFITKKLL